MSAVALKDLRQAIANRIHTRTHELSRKLTDQEIRSKQHVPEASSVPIPVAKYVHDDKVIDLTHSEIESEPTSVHKQEIHTMVSTGLHTTTTTETQLLVTLFCKQTHHKSSSSFSC